jgi:hypothetical protein
VPTLDAIDGAVHGRGMAALAVVDDALSVGDTCFRLPTQCIGLLICGSGSLRSLSHVSHMSPVPTHAGSRACLLAIAVSSLYVCTSILQ